MPNSAISWPLPFKGRNPSGTYNQNFVWKCGNVYVMDNHRAALWCWLQELDLTRTHSLFHIDQHTDCLQSRLDEWMENLPSWDSSLDDYLSHSHEYDLITCPLIRWDNYLSIYFEEFGQNVAQCYFATHGEGDEPNCSSVVNADIWDLPTNMEGYLNKADAPWIMNIDLDYFYWDGLDKPGLMVSDEFLLATFTPIKNAIDTGLIAVTTICLTPDEPMTPGWTATEELASRILKILGMDFHLPT